jgi:Tfp pilus assembly protein FimT
MRARPRLAGVTLLELTLVLTLIGLLMAIAAPKFGALADGVSVRSASGDVAAAFSLARQAAITQRTRIAVVFDTSGGRIVVRGGGATVLERDLRAAYGIVLVVNRDSAVYDPRGLGYGLSNLTVTVSRGRMIDTLTMSRLGRVR